MSRSRLFASDGVIHIRKQGEAGRRKAKGAYERRDFEKELAEICLRCSKAYCSTGKCKEYTQKEREVRMSDQCAY